MKRKLIKRNKQFMSKLLKGSNIGSIRGKFIFKHCSFNLWRSNKPHVPLKISYTIWKFRRNNVLHDLL